VQFLYRRGTRVQWRGVPGTWVIERQRWAQGGSLSPVVEYFVRKVQEDGSLTTVTAWAHEADVSAAEEDS
jgi:hypothetical protein